MAGVLAVAGSAADEAAASLATSAASNDELVMIGLALAIGAVITLLDGVARYNTRDRVGLGGPASAADPVDIPPRFFTSERGYIASVLLYLAAMEAIFLVPAIAVPHVLGPESGWIERSPLLGVADELREWGKPATFPIIWALLLAGALRFLPWLNHVEPRIRRLCHNIAEIPHFVHEVARRLYTLEIDLKTAFPSGLSGDLLFVEPEHFNAPLSSEERGWARLCYVMRELEELYTELGNLPAVHFGSRFAEEYEDAAAEYRSLAHRMARFFDVKERKDGGSGRASSLGSDHRLKADLLRLLGRAELLFVILLNLRCRDERQIIARLQGLGFKFDHERLRSEVGPDAAVSVLALAVILFVLCPVMAALVDLGMLEALGGDSVGWIAYPDSITRRGPAAWHERVLVILLLSFVTLLVLAFANLTIARKFAGIDPREMFDGRWLQRPYGKYIRAALVPALLCYGTAVGLLFALSQVPGTAESLPVPFKPVLMSVFVAPLFIMGVVIHVFAHNEGRSFLQVLWEGVLSGLVWGAIIFVTAFFFFGAIELDGQRIPREEVLGACVYYGAYAFLVGSAFMAALLQISKSARATENAAPAAGGLEAEHAAATRMAGGNVTALRR